jgi:hypothetical protein
MKKTLLMLALAAGITSFAQNAQAELVTINIGPTGFNIGGTNGGVANGSFAQVADFPISGNSISLYNNFSGSFTGLERAPGPTGFSFATGTNWASPVNFAPNALIDSNSNYGDGPQGLFKFFTGVSPDFGSGSYMGFRTAQNNYGWLEVTWTASSGQFQILSGAYESVADVGIRAGAGPTAPIPEPGTWAAMAIFAGGAAFAGWRRRKSAKIAA